MNDKLFERIMLPLYVALIFLYLVFIGEMILPPLKQWALPPPPVYSYVSKHISNYTEEDAAYARRHGNGESCIQIGTTMKFHCRRNLAEAVKGQQCSDSGRVWLTLVDHPDVLYCGEDVGGEYLKAMGLPKSPSSFRFPKDNIVP